MSENWQRSPVPWMAEAITAAQAGHSRSRQRGIGPSEVGTRCQRKLALRVVHAEHEELPRPPGGSLRPFVGTATHAALADALVGDLDVRTEVAVAVNAHLAGTADVLRRQADGRLQVWDFKVVGPATMRAAGSGVISSTYQDQLDLYGLGAARTLGVDVALVGIIFVPSAGELSEIVSWARPYVEARAVEVERRHEAVRRAVARRFVAATSIGDALSDIVAATAAADDYCESCPFWSTVHRGVLLCAGAPKIIPAGLDVLD